MQATVDRKAEQERRDAEFKIRLREAERGSTNESAYRTLNPRKK